VVSPHYVVHVSKAGQTLRRCPRLSSAFLCGRLPPRDFQPVRRTVDPSQGCPHAARAPPTSLKNVAVAVAAWGQSLQAVRPTRTTRGRGAGEAGGGGGGGGGRVEGVAQIAHSFVLESIGRDTGWGSILVDVHMDESVVLGVVDGS